MLKQQVCEKDIKIDESGSMKFLYKENGIRVVTRNDNDAVTAHSNVHTNLSHTQVKRWDSPQESYIKIKQHNFFKQYSKNMSGVYGLNVIIHVYRIDVRGKNGIGFIKSIQLI